MARRISPEWKKARTEEIKKREFISVVTAYNPAAQWLITYLAEKDIPVNVSHLGAGVKRITVAKNVCPTCKGKGFVNKEAEGE